MRRVAVVNESTLIGPDDLACCAVAVQTQVSRDFASTWGIDAVVRVTAQPDDEEELLTVCDDVGAAEAAGLHRLPGPRPRGFVFVRPCLEAGEPWQTALSRELLALLADPLLCLTALGPAPPLLPEKTAAVYAVEVCDPVAGDSYDLGGVPVANFVLPTWFTTWPLPDQILVDFLGRLAEPFSLTPTGQVPFCTELGAWRTWWGRRCPKHRRQATALSRLRRRLAGR